MLRLAHILPFITPNKLLYLIIGLVIGYILGSSSLLSLIMLLIAGFLYGNQTKISVWVYLKKTARMLQRHAYKLQTHFLNTKLPNTTAINVDMRCKTLIEMEAYCRWSGMKNLREFVEKSAVTVFEQDKAWIAYQKKLAKQKN